MLKHLPFAGAVLLASASYAPSVHAHFKLLSPSSWLKEDDLGGPQKGSPCGPGGTGLLGDDVSPVPLSNAMTEVRAGDTVLVDIQETIYHPGYFRIALAEKREDFAIPPVDNPMSCAFDLDKVPTTPHDNVLLDGLFKVETMSGALRRLKQEVKLPDEPCEKCTLQVIQVMLNHGASSCYYYHCADLKILPAANGAAGASGAAAAGRGSTSSTGGTPAAGSGGASGNTGAIGGSTAAAGSTATTGGAGTNVIATAGQTASGDTTGSSIPTASAGRSGTTSPASTAAGTSAPTAMLPSTPTAPPTERKSSSCSLISSTGSDWNGALAMLGAAFVLGRRRLLR